MGLSNWRTPLGAATGSGARSAAFGPNEMIDVPDTEIRENFDRAAWPGSDAQVYTGFVNLLLKVGELSP